MFKSQVEQGVFLNRHKVMKYFSIHLFWAKKIGLAPFF